MMDISEVKQFLGPTLHMATVFDAFSRVPLVLQVFDQTPCGRDMSQILRTAARAFARPRYLITDKGGQFIEGTFLKTVRRLGAQHRFASTGSILATARLERFWRTLKETAGLCGPRLPLTREDLERRLELPILYYLSFRPHEGLRGATPAEAFLGTTPAHEAAVEPPRGRPGDGPARAPFEIDFLDPATRRLPLLLHTRRPTAARGAAERRGALTAAAPSLRLCPARRLPPLSAGAWRGRPHQGSHRVQAA
jgi:hypothetical protein